MGSVLGPTRSLNQRPVVIDRFSRPLTSLRISVTDRCNMRCGYCMPEAEYAWLPRSSILSFEELDRLAGIFVSVGVRKIRLTGGEPLLRHGLPDLVHRLASRPELTDLALTTNGILLATQAAQLRDAGLQRLTVSLDTLRPERMLSFARSSKHGDVLAGITAARDAGFPPVKLNSVIVRGYNDDELEDLVDFGKSSGVEVRFIEYMDVGGATGWSMEKVVSRREILERLTGRYGQIEPLVSGRDPAAPAERFRLGDGTTFGIIASTTQPFCRSCDRSRLTADGHFLLCLYADEGVDLREPLRSGATDEEIREQIVQAWKERDDRGAEVRGADPHRGALYSLTSLRSDPLREMHTRGG
ncbi:MAG TPA: GTP 3',8-cyclase MoaA [Gemmatimonadales bacterium]|nr:GTP 3',8-cyclase MoaA [Gemmatimonadales bacterium]